MPSGFHTWSTTGATNATADSNIGWAEGQAPSTINDSARNEMAVLAKWRDDNNGSLTTGGTTTALTLTTNTVFTTLALMNNQTLAFTMNATSGATPTLNVDSLGAKVIRNATGVALPTGALLSGSVYRASYNNSSGEWLLHNQPGVIPSSSVATGSIADDAVTFAKMQNSSGGTVIGKNDAGSGDFKEIGIGAGLTFSGASLVTTTSPSLFPGFLSGLELSTAGSSATFGIAAGAANDTTNATLMALASAYTKTTSAWAVGTGNGALDTSTIATSTWYHVYQIARSDTGVVDVLISTSASAPTMPTNYDRKRRIGSMKTNGSSQWTAFTQTYDQFIWTTGAIDASAVSATTSRVSKTLTVPTGIVVEAMFRAQFNFGGNNAILFTALFETDSDPTSSTFNDIGGSAAGVLAAGDFRRFVNTSAQIGVRSAVAVGSYSINTYGWIDTRGK